MIFYIRINSVLHSLMGNTKRMSDTKHSRVTQNGVTTLKLPGIYLFMSFPLPPALTTTVLFTITILLPSPECYIAGILQYMPITFSVSFTQFFLLSPTYLQSPAQKLPHYVFHSSSISVLFSSY